MMCRPYGTPMSESDSLWMCEPWSESLSRRSQEAMSMSMAAPQCWELWESMSMSKRLTLSRSRSRSGDRFGPQIDPLRCL